MSKGFVLIRNRFLVLILTFLILSSFSAQPAHATDESINIACSDGGSFNFNSTTHELSSAITCKGSAEIPDGATVGKAFAGSGVTKIQLPDDTLALEAGMFTSTLITSFDLPSQINQVNGEAFSGSNIQTINVPEGAKGLSADSFSMATHLQSINVDPGNPVYKSVDGVLFDSNFTTLLMYPIAKPESSYSMLLSTHGAQLAFGLLWLQKLRRRSRSKEVAIQIRVISLELLRIEFCRNSFFSSPCT